MKIQELKDKIVNVIYESCKENIIEEGRENDILSLDNSLPEIEDSINECNSLSELIDVMNDWGFDRESAFDEIDEIYTFE
jgi:hypothetical protein